MVADCDAALKGDTEALRRCADALANARAMEDEPDPSDRLFEAMWDGTVDGDAFDGDPADLW